MKKIFFLLLALSYGSTIYSQKLLWDDIIWPDGIRGYNVNYWEKNNLKYYFSNYSSTLTSTECSTAIQNAFATWAYYSIFNFTQTNDSTEADIKLLWATGAHGNCFSFSPNNNVLAHASLGNYAPSYIHFNENYPFSTDGSAYDLESVALHEIGHVLGLEHDSLHNTAVMYPWAGYGAYGIKRSLTYEDINSLYSLYGYPSTVTGINTMSQQGVYEITNLHPLFDVIWSLSDNYYNQNCIQQDTPSKNKCTIVRSNSQDMSNATLTATVKYNDVTLYTTTKASLYAHAGFKGTYTNGQTTKQINLQNPLWVLPGTVVCVSSPNLINSTETYSGDATPTYWVRGVNTLYVGMPSTSNKTLVLYVTCENGDCYTIPIITTTNLNQLSINVSEGVINVSLTKEGDDNVLQEIEFANEVYDTRKNYNSWLLEVFNALTGQKIFSHEVEGTSYDINTTGWETGIYPIRVTIGEVVLSEKVVVK